MRQRSSDADFLFFPCLSSLIDFLLVLLSCLSLHHSSFFAVFAPIPAGPSRQRATTSSSNTAEARLVSRFAPDGDRERYRAEQARMLADARATAQRRRDAAAAARRAEDDEIYGLGGGAAGGYGGAFNYGGGAGIYGLYQLLAQGVAGGVGGGGGGMLDYGALLGYGGDGIPGGLQGLYGAGGGGAGNAGWGGAERVKKGKKYGPRMSHPHKIEQGFARDIIELPDPDDPPPPPAKRKKGSKAPAPAAKPELLEPVCSSCLEPLLLAQSGSQRPWALRCGHVVCGGCIGSARKRVEAAKRKEREIVLGSDDEMDGGAGSESDGELKYVGDSSDDEEEGDEAITGRRATRTRRAAATKAKSKTLTSSRVKATSANTKPITLSKGKAKSLPTDVDSSWTTCPIVNCGGDKTNLGKDVGEGAVEGAWELFV